MKLKYLIPSLMAVLAVLVGCSDDNDPTFLDEVRLSSSFVTIDLNGGSTDITVTASDNWSIDTSEIPEWLTVSPTSGAAGQSKITFSAGVGEYGKLVELHLACAGRTQNINVQQGVPAPSDATCADVIAGPDGKQYRVKGTVTSIANVSPYGNWYLADETGQVYIYGTADADGKLKNDALISLGIEVGDVVTVEGPKTTYNGTVELVDVMVVSVEKSLLKILSESKTMTKEGGNLEVTVVYKGSGTYPEIADNCKDWVKYEGTTYKPGIPTLFETNPGDTAIVRFSVAENTEKTRNGSIEFSSTSYDSKKGSTSSTVMTYSFTQKGVSNPPTGTGTEENPYNVTAGLDAAAAGATGVCVRGIVSRKPTFNSKYSSLTYYISVDGEQNDELQVYSSKSFSGGNYASADDIQLGDVVVVKGNLKNYNGTLEVDQSSTLITLNEQTSMDKVNIEGSYRKPFDVAGAINYINNGGKENVFVKGVVSKIINAFEPGYGNGTFWISDDGVYNSDYSKDFEAYHAYWLGNNKWAAGDDQLAVGDNVVIYGLLTKYKDTYETSDKKAYVYNCNGKVK